MNNLSLSLYGIISSISLAGKLVLCNLEIIGINPLHLKSAEDKVNT